jgi:ornithine racemase
LAYPQIVIDRAKLAHNAREICSIAARQGVKISGVTKACLANEAVARALVAGGIKELADSRLENLERLQKMNLGVSLLLLRIPGLSQVQDIVRLADTSLNSEYEVMAALAEEAIRQQRIHGIIIMVDLGDLREGVLPKHVVPLAKRVEKLKGLRIKGIGVNLACYGGVIPTQENLGQLVQLAQDVEKELGRKLEVVSGGNSSSLDMLFEGEIPKGITNLRIGEGILLGRETINRNSVPNVYQDCFTLQAEVVESQIKPSKPIGVIGQDAFGNVPVFDEKGPMVRSIVALGRQDVPPEGILPLDPCLHVVGASSDHLIIDATQKPGIQVGFVVEFCLQYSGLLGAMTSPFVSKKVLDGNLFHRTTREVGTVLHWSNQESLEHIS